MMDDDIHHYGSAIESQEDDIMQAKRFIAADMRRALDMVKTELGEDAMILSTERTAKGVELVATVEPALSLHDPLSDYAQMDKNPAVTKAAARFKSMATPSSPSHAPQLRSASRASGSVPLTPTATQASTHSSHQSTLHASGLSSGKTPEQLAEEIELASRKMLAAKKMDSMTIEQLAAASPSSHSASTSNHAAVTDTPQTNHSLVDADHNDRLHGDNSGEDIRRLHHEINEMRQQLNIQLSEMAASQERQYLMSQNDVHRGDITPVAKDIRQSLQHLGLTQACNDQLMAKLHTGKIPSTTKQVAWMGVLTELAKNIPHDISDQVSKGGAYAFLGTTGVGKTTTIAKLAARYVIDNNQRNVVLLTTDNYRIASHKQLKSLANILNIQIHVVEDLQALPRTIAQFPSDDLLLIDTPGMGHSDPLLKEHLTVLQQCQRVKKLLVLSANSQYQMMKASLHSYRSAGLQACVLTKLDECASLGDAISMLSEHQLPMVYTTDGQSVPDDIAVAKSSQLISRAVGMAKQQHQQKDATQHGVIHQRAAHNGEKAII